MVLNDIESVLDNFFARKQDSMYLEELQEIWDVDFQLPHPQLKWLVQIYNLHNRRTTEEQQKSS